jgi:hypothetical protein
MMAGHEKYLCPIMSWQHATVEATQKEEVHVYWFETVIYGEKLQKFRIYLLLIV